MAVLLSLEYCATAVKRTGTMICSIDLFDFCGKSCACDVKIDMICLSWRNEPDAVDFVSYLNSVT